MYPSTARGNNPQRWETFLNHLDDRLQLGLLDHLKRISSYHFEDNVLFINPGNAEDDKYLKREAVFQQLQVLAQDSIGVEKVVIKSE